jgi:hypothetical protein
LAVKRNVEATERVESGNPNPKRRFLAAKKRRRRRLRKLGSGVEIGRVRTGAKNRGERSTLGWRRNVERLWNASKAER